TGVAAPIPPEEVAALVGASLEQVEQWRREGLLDPEGLGRFDELDLVRWLTIHGHEARGYRSDQLAAAITAGEVRPFMGEFLFPSGRTLTLEEAAEPAIVQAVHHEHLLHASIEDAYLHLPSSEIPAERGSVETTIVFLDLESFTELTHTKGDELAVETLTRLEDAVRPLALEHEGKLVKQIGDGVMLAFRRSDEAVAFARQALDAVAAD